jgi:F-type H+-transporting ATPase subunit b
MEKLIEEFSIGLFFWQTVIFVILIFILKKYAWGPILKAVNDREQGIKEALQSAELAKEEMESLKADNDKIMKQARVERDALLKEARDLKNSIVSQAKDEAKTEAQKIIESANEAIKNEKMQLFLTLKNKWRLFQLILLKSYLKKSCRTTTNKCKLLKNF